MLFFLVALVFFFPAFPLEHHFYQQGDSDDNMEIDDSEPETDTSEEEIEEGYHDGNNDDDNGNLINDIDHYVRWKVSINNVVDYADSEYQNLYLVSTEQYGKSLITDGDSQCCEKDEFIFHENLIHPALLAHNSPKTVFIMGGGSGSAAREVLKHKVVERVTICEIDQEVVRMCREHMSANHEAFNDERLQIVYKDAKEKLEESEEKFDVIIGDVNLPEIAISKELYRISFYNTVKTKLNHNGIFVTQAGPAGTFTHMDIFSPIHYTLKKAFTYVVPYKAHVPSFGDVCGWVMASDSPITLNTEELDKRIVERLRGELYYLDGPVIVATTILDKTTKESLMEEFHVITEDSSALVRGDGLYSKYL